MAILVKKRIQLGKKPARLKDFGNGARRLSLTECGCAGSPALSSSKKINTFMNPIESEV